MHNLPVEHPSGNGTTVSQGSWETISPQELFALIAQGLTPFIQGLGMVLSADPARGTVTTTTGTYPIGGPVTVASTGLTFEKALPWIAVGGVVLLAVVVMMKK